MIYQATSEDIYQHNLEESDLDRFFIIVCGCIFLFDTFEAAEKAKNSLKLLTPTSIPSGCRQAV